MRVFLLSFFIILATCPISAQQDTSCVNPWVDSIFCENFMEMEYAIDNNLKYDNYVNRNFVYLLSYLSGIECSGIHFSGFCDFDKNKLVEWQDWYKINKCKILKEKVIWGLAIIKKEDKTQDQIDSLKYLKIIN